LDDDHCGALELHREEEKSPNYSLFEEKQLVKVLKTKWQSWPSMIR